MQRKVTGGSVTFNQLWVDYRDGFGSPTGNDNYWLGLGKVYRLMQLGNVRLRIEVIQVAAFAVVNCPSSYDLVAEYNYCKKS